MVAVYIGFLSSLLAAFGLTGLAIWIHYFQKPGADVGGLALGAMAAGAVAFLLMVALADASVKKPPKKQ